MDIVKALHTLVDVVSGAKPFIESHTAEEIKQAVEDHFGGHDAPEQPQPHAELVAGGEPEGTSPGVPEGA